MKKKQQQIGTITEQQRQQQIEELERVFPVEPNRPAPGPAPERPKKHSNLVTVEKMTRDDVVPFYADLLIIRADSDDVRRMNQLILSRWTVAGLIYIKEKAWKLYYRYQEEVAAMLIA